MAASGDFLIIIVYINLSDIATLGRRYDVTQLFGNYQAFSALLDDLLELCREIEYDTVAGIDALGFILGTGSVVRSEKHFEPIRKDGKLPVEVHRECFIDYAAQDKSLEIRSDALEPSNRVLLVDEWIETAVQVKVAISLMEGPGAEITAVISIAIDGSRTIRELRESYSVLEISQDL